MKCKLDRHFYPSGENSSFNCHEMRFSEYATHMRSIIDRTRVDITRDNRATIIEANAPHEYIPKDTDAAKPRVGVLLLHGLFDSTLSMQSLFNHYKSKQYYVRSLLLPGHGTRPGDLLDIDLREWIAATQYGIDSFRNMVDKIIVVGFSTGAGLGMYLSILGAPIDGLVCFAPSIRIMNRLAYYGHWHKLLSWSCDRFKWFCITDELDYAKYQSYSFSAPYQVSLLSKRILAYCDKYTIQVPLYMVISEDDEVVTYKDTVDFFQHQLHPDSHLTVYTNQPSQYHDKRIETIPSANPEKNILDYSHTCLTTAPDHPHYGEHGDYQDYFHYRTSLGKYLKHRHDKEIFYGSLSAHNLRNYHLQRLRYNPDFDRLMKKIDLFVDKII